MKPLTLEQRDLLLALRSAPPSSRVWVFRAFLSAILLGGLQLLAAPAIFWPVLISLPLVAWLVFLAGHKIRTRDDLIHRLLSSGPGQGGNQRASAGPPVPPPLSTAHAPAALPDAEATLA